MNRNLTLVLFAIVFFCSFHQVASAQNLYGRKQDVYDDGVSKMNDDDFDAAKDIFEKLKKSLHELPEGNDLDSRIRGCTKLELKAKQLSFGGSAADQKTISVTSNAHELEYLSKPDSWCVVSLRWEKTKDNKVKTRSSTITVKCEANNSAVTRVTKFWVRADKLRTEWVTITQEGGELSVSIDPEYVEFSDSGGVQSIDVHTNAAGWQVDSLPSWVAIVDMEKTVFQIKAEKNYSPMERQGFFYVFIKGVPYKITFRQKGSEGLIETSKKEIMFPSEGATDGFVVFSNHSSWTYTQTDDSWFLATRVGDSVKVHANPSTSPISREGRLTINASGKSCEVTVRQQPYVTELVMPQSELAELSAKTQAKVLVESNPSDLKMTLTDSEGKTLSRTTPFEMPVDFKHYHMTMGMEQRDVIFNKQQETVVFSPGMRFACFTWAPNTSIGVMSGYVGARSFGAYCHVSVNTPFVSDLSANAPGLTGYNVTFGPVYRPIQFPYVGAYAGVGIGGYVWEPHVGLDYEAGVMGFYKNFMLTAGFHTSLLTSTVKSTSFMIGVGGYLKRYYDENYGYCASDSRRWASVSYMFRPSENGKGVMVGDLGTDKVRGYVKALYLNPIRTADSLKLHKLEAGFGIVVTPVNGIIDMCAGASVDFAFNKELSPFQGMGLEIGAIVNIWRFPLTIMFHEADLFGERHLCIDFGVGFHFGEFGWKKSTYR